MEPAQGTLISKDAADLLASLKQVHDRKSFAAACDGRAALAAAHELEEKGFAEWKGTSYGSSFWAITELGLKNA